MSDFENSYSSEDLARYLRQVRFDDKNEGNLAFDSFLENVDEIVALRMRAEEFWGGSPKGSAFDYIDHKYLAYNPREALPLELRDVFDELCPPKERPPRRIVLQVAHLIEEITHISSGMRRILLRERFSTPVSNVQQLDTHCIRWLMRQPGRSIVEKAGTKQRILSVVRRENYNTLENRVFKDFLLRSANLAERYLKSLKAVFKNNNCNEYVSVKRLKIACLSALKCPEMDSISEIKYLPLPNYVLLQDNYYSKIWDMYRKIILQSKLAEKLWKHRDKIEKELCEVKKYVGARCDNDTVYKYKSIVWINPFENHEGQVIDHFLTNLEEVDKSVLIEREQDNVDHMINDNIGVIDLTGEDVFGVCLIEKGIHSNAKPRIERKSYPLWDDQLVNNSKSEFNEYSINDVCSIDEIQKAGKEDCRFEKYGHCLIGEYKNNCNDLNELVILVPDDWDIYTQESVIRAFSDMGRESVHLIWRSIAAVIGYQEKTPDFSSKRIRENEKVLVVDFRIDNTVIFSSIKYLLNTNSGKLIPQRGSYKGNNNCRHYGPYSHKSYLRKLKEVVEKEHNLNFILVTGSISEEIRIELRNHLSYFFFCNKIAIEDAVDDWLLLGARKFCKNREIETLYYDELETMYIIGQEKENIVWPQLIPGLDRCEGGKIYNYKIDEGKFYISAGQKGIKFLFHIGTLTNKTELHSYSQDLLVEKTNKNIPLYGEVSISPGQGLAVTKIYSDELGLNVELDYLRNMKMDGDSIAKLEREIRRSYPPICPYVESYGDSSKDLQITVSRYLDRSIYLDDKDNGLFYKPKNIQESEIGPNDSILKILGRKNIFGNDPCHLRPEWLSEEKETKLIGMISNEYFLGREKMLRLLAWTYRGSHPGVKSVVEIIVKKYKDKGSITASECSLLSNTLYDKNLLFLEKEVFKCFFERLKNGEANLHDYRMIYNIAQFDEKLFEKIDIKEEEMVNYYECLKRYIKTPYLNDEQYRCALKCMLYFLRYREFHPDFLRKKDDYNVDPRFKRNDDLSDKMGTLHEELSELMKDRSYYYYGNTQAIQNITKSFLEGDGQLKDLVTIINDDNKTKH